MSRDGARLEAFRNALPRVAGEAFPAGSLSVAAGLKEERWRQIERKESWAAAAQKDELQGVTEALRRTDATPETRAAWIAFVSGESHDLPTVALAWQDGLCPLVKRGRPARKTVRKPAPSAVFEAGTPAGEVEDLLRRLAGILRREALDLFRSDQMTAEEVTRAVRVADALPALRDSSEMSWIPDTLRAA